MSNLFVFGLGYSAMAVASIEKSGGWRVSGTVRSKEKAKALAQRGIEGITPLFSKIAPPLKARSIAATHVLVSTPPNEEGDPALIAYGQALRDAPALRWIGYLSTIGVYGDHHDSWLRGHAGVFAGGAEISAHRGREGLGGVRARARHPPRHFSSGRDLRAWAKPPRPHPRRRRKARCEAGPSVQPRSRGGHCANCDCRHSPRAAGRWRGIYNVADDEPAPPQDVLLYAADLLGAPPRPKFRSRRPIFRRWRGVSTETTSASTTPRSSASLGSCCAIRPTERDCRRLRGRFVTIFDRSEEFSEGRAKQRQVLGARKTVLAILDERQADIRCCDGVHQVKRMPPWHIGVFAAMQIGSGHRSERDLRRKGGVCSRPGASL